MKNAVFWDINTQLGNSEESRTSVKTQKYTVVCVCTGEPYGLDERHIKESIKPVNQTETPPLVSTKSQ
jgi:hypothetical protein